MKSNRIRIQIGQKAQKAQVKRMKKVIQNDYRCSCCDEMKSSANQVYKLWTQVGKPENSPVVVICRKCNAAMRKAGFKGVEQFLARKEQNI